MNWKNVKLVFLREVRDQLRDRRTLFMVAVLPLLLYPALGLGMLQMTLLFSEQPRTVVILGADDLPLPPLVIGDRFDGQYFDFPQEADKLIVITDATPEGEATEDVDPTEKKTATLETARQLRSQVESIVELGARRESAIAQQDAVSLEVIDAQLATLKSAIGEAMSVGQMQVLILVPEGFREHVEETNRLIAERDNVPEAMADPPRLRIVRNSADEKSMIAYRRVKQAVSHWETVLLEQRLSAANLPVSLPNPINPEQIDLAQEAQLAANLWSKLFPTLLIIMAVTGAFYPAIDLGAGEKERGTMETLLISPAKRTEIVMGKFFTVLLFSMSTALLNLMSMGFTGKHMLSLAGGGAVSKFGDVAFPPLASLGWVFLLAIPLAALFSSLSLGLAMFARSSKEGQYYLTPLLMVTMGLTVFCLSPVVEITPFYSVLPIMGPALLLKALLLGAADSGSLYWYALPVLATSFLYSGLALWWAIEQFKREDILFRNDDQFDLGLWIKHVLRDKESLPSFTEGAFCFVLIMLLQFAAIRFMGPSTIGATPAELMKLLMIQQLVIIATPALLMAVMLTTSVRQTLRLHWPKFKYLLVAAILAPLLHPVTVELSMFLGQHFFPPLPESAQKAIAPMLDPAQASWLVFLAFAVAPGICEELAFRGFILSGFVRNGRTSLAIVLSAIVFGVMHMFPQQVFNAALLGLLLGLIAIRSNSLLPGIVFHMLYNGTEVFRNRIPTDVWTMPAMKWMVSVESIEGHDVVRYSWPLLVVCAVIATVLIRWLIRDGQGRVQETPTVADASPLAPSAGC